ncbi:MAG: alpha/beta hydrolase-fold protein [Acidobacteriota bacterium]|nr:alpha/beta hydrolase-fold protein [Acidobacteriota bacterium]
MHKRHEMIPSRAMGRHIHVWCYGHYGPPLIAFPSAAGFAHEWDAQGMTEVLAPLINGGKLKLYCPESNVSHTWTGKGDPAHRARGHLAYEVFIIKELIPWIAADCHQDQIEVGASGCSLGGFYAANFALKYPEYFNYALAMSGRYQMTHFTGGFSNGDIYFNNPLAYVPNLEGEYLHRVQQTHVSLVCGRGQWEEGCIEETIALGEILKRKEIPNEVDIWGRDSSHQWPWWRRQALYHLGRRYG